MNVPFATCLLLLQFIGFGPAAVTSWAQPAKPAQLLPVHTIKIINNYATKKPASGNEGLLNSLRLENEADTIFVEKTWSEDMGYVYGVAYTFKNNIPNGTYKFVINGTVSTESTLENGMLEGMQKYYQNGILSEEIPFHLGVSNGYGRYYDSESPHNVKAITYHHDNRLYISTYLNPAGEVVGRTYSTRDGSGIPYRDEKKESGWVGPANSSLTRSGIPVKDGSSRNGLYELTSLFGKYQLFFKDDLIEWWRWLDEDGKLVVEVHAEPGQRL